MDTLSSYYEPLEGSGQARQLWDAASQVMQIQSVRWLDQGVSRAVGRATPSQIRALEMRGKLLVDSARAYDLLADRFRAQGYVLLLRREGNGHKILALEGELPRSAGRPWVSVLLFAATLLSVLWVGSGYSDEPGQLLAGWPFAASLLGILLAHEMGHYLVARWQGVPASLPYFIPFPTILGTMGAVIQTKAPPKSRRALLMLGAAGPWAGMVMAIPILLLGLGMSPVERIPAGIGYFQEGNSLLYAGLKLWVFGRFLPSGGVDVMLSSVAFAGWAGLLVTAMNLIPAGQLDGGHIAYALLGERARWLNWAVVGALLVLSVLWQGWLLWAGLVLLLGRVHSVPLDDVTPLEPQEKAIALLSLVLFVLVFIPIPMAVQ